MVFAQQLTALAFALVLLVVSVAVASQSSLAHVSATAWLSALAAGALYYGVAFWFYVTGLRGVRPGYAGMFLNLIPVFGLLTSYAALGERMAPRQWIGAFVILCALVAMTAVQTRSRSGEVNAATR